MRWCIRCTKVTYRNNSINSFSLSYGIFLTKPLQIIVQKILICFIAALTIALIQFWNQLSSLYNVCTLVCAMMVCIGIQGKKNRLLQVGIKMHIFSTVIVVLLSIVSLVLIIFAGAKDKSSRSYGIFAAIALGMNCLRQQAEICLDIPIVIHR